MIAALALAAGCGGAGPATEPDPGASRAVAEALCDLARGGKSTCDRTGTKAVINGDGLQVAVFLDTVEDRFGQYTFDGRAVLTRDNGDVITTRYKHYGWGREEAIEKGTHYWAVLSGAAVVDWVLRDGSRPALRALESDEHPGVTQWRAGDSRVLRGWTLLRGVVVVLDHPAIVASIAPHLKTLPPAAPHVVHIRIASELGEQEFTCHVDGQPDPALCAAAKAAPWPAGVGWELQQVYLAVPGDSFPDAAAVVR